MTSPARLPESVRPPDATRVASTAPAGAAIARNALYLVLAQVASTALSIVLNAVLGRSLGPADFGLLFLVTSWTAFANDIAAWGLSSYLVREVARQPERAGELLGTGVAFRVLNGALVCAPAVAVVALLGYDARTCALLALAIGASVPLAVSAFVGFVFRGRERMDRDAIVTVAAKALNLALVVPTLAVGGRVASVLLAQAAAGMGAVIVGALLLRGERLDGLRPTRLAFRELLVGGAPLVALGLGNGAQAFLETVVLSKSAPAVALGWYGASKTFMGLLITPASIIGTAAYPRMSRAAHDTVAFGHEVRTAVRPLLLVGALGSVGTYVFAHVAVGIVYSLEKFGPAVVIVQVFAPMLLLLFLESALSSALVAARRPRELALAKLVTVLLGLGLNLVLVPACQARFGNGGIGAVLGFGGSELAMLCATVALLPRGVLDRTVGRDVLRSLAAGAGTLLLAPWLARVSPWIGIPACVGAFGAASVATGLVRRDDLEVLRALVSRRSADHRRRG